MRKTHKDSKTEPDQNFERIQKQQKTEDRVKNGELPSTSPNIKNGLIKGDADPDKKFQSATPGHPIFAVNPELERQMAAQDVAQNKTSSAIQHKIHTRQPKSKKLPKNE